MSAATSLETPLRRTVAVGLRTALAIGVVVGDGGSVEAAAHFLTVDVPSQLGGSTAEPHEIMRYDGGVYSVDASLPPGTEVTALLLGPDHAWYFTPAHPLTLGGIDFEPRDIVIGQGTSFTPLLYGSSVGIPDYARIDGLSYIVTDAEGLALLLSFDVPLSLAGADYLPADVVALDSFSGAYSLFWDSVAAGVPRSANVAGLDRDPAGSLVLSFDSPVTLGASTFLPGQLVRWDGGSAFSLYHSDPTWPEGSRLGDFALPPAAGVVPDGRGGSTPLLVDKLPDGEIVLSWGESCSPLDLDYGVYEGTIGGAFDDHAPATCTTGGATTVTLPPGTGSRYFLIVPRNEVTEGSYGYASGAPRSPSASACLPQEVAVVCD